MVKTLSAAVRWYGYSILTLLPQLIHTSHIQRLRLERGWSLVTLAKRSGMNATYLGVMEKGGNMLSIETLYELAHVFNVEAWEILREFGDPDQPATPKSE